VSVRKDVKLRGKVGMEKSEEISIVRETRGQFTGENWSNDYSEAT
jgi:hypothetical protein